jgi:hypothetical protein
MLNLFVQGFKGRQWNSAAEINSTTVVSMVIGRNIVTSKSSTSSTYTFTIANPPYKIN